MTKAPTTPNQPKTVSLSTYLQSLAIAILVTGVLSFVASYFFALNLQGQVRESIIGDMQALPKDQPAKSSK